MLVLRSSFSTLFKIMEDGEGQWQKRKEKRRWDQALSLPTEDNLSATALEEPFPRAWCTMEPSARGEDRPFLSEVNTQGFVFLTYFVIHLGTNCGRPTISLY